MSPAVPPSAVPNLVVSRRLSTDPHRSRRHRARTQHGVAMTLAPAAASDTAPLLVTTDAELSETIARLCAAAGVEPVLLGRADHCRSRWRTASCVLVGRDAASELAAVELPRRPDVIIVCAQPESIDVWRDAVAVGAARVVRLPSEQEWLVRWLGDASDGAGAARVVGLVGAGGGAGASTLATALAVRSARQRQTCLIDADPLSGGIELVLGSEHCDGLRWSDIAVTTGQVGSAAFRAALPEHRGVTVLSWAREAPEPVEATTMRRMLDNAARSFELILLDLPRQGDDAAIEALHTCQRVLVVATADVRCAAATAALLPKLERHAADLHLVVRTAKTSAVLPEAIADSLRMPLAAVLPTRRAVGRNIAEGLGPPARGALMARCDRLLTSLLAGPVSA